MADRGTKLRILHCIPSLESGGAERQLSILAPAQVANGCEVHVTYLTGGPYLNVLSRGGVQLHQIRARGNHDPRIAFGLWGLIGKLEPDIVQTWIPLMDIVGGIVAVCRRTPWVMTERSSSPGYSSRFKDRVVRRMLGRWADAIVANSSVGSTLWENQRRRGTLVKIVPNVLSLKSIDDSTPVSLGQFGVASNHPVVIFVGRLSYEKKVDFLLTVAMQVCNSSSAVFLICGDGPARREAEALVNGSPFPDRIKLLGYRDDVWGLMKASHAFVSTSAFEGHPNAVLEAMACRCPLVVSDIPAHRAFLDAETAEIVPLLDDDFVTAILRVIAGGPDITKRVAAARARAESGNPAAAAFAYLAIYDEVVRRRDPCAA